MSEPQMVEAFTRNKTSPWSGAGTGTVRISTVEFPGRYAAVIVSFISFVSRFKSRSMQVAGAQCGPN
jgi:hypothetical protein